MERDENVQRLAKLMGERRVALRKKWEDVAADADVSGTFLRKIRNGAGASPLTIANLEAALRWAPGSFQRILDGGDPIEVADVSATSSIAATINAAAEVVKADDQTGEGLEAAIRELARRLSPDRVRSVLEEFASPASQGSDAPSAERLYEDDAEQRIWEIVELEPVIRRQLIGMLHYTRKALAEGPQGPSAEVREFRPRG